MKTISLEALLTVVFRSALTSGLFIKKDCIGWINRIDANTKRAYFGLELVKYFSSDKPQKDAKKVANCDVFEATFGGYVAAELASGGYHCYDSHHVQPSFWIYPKKSVPSDYNRLFQAYLESMPMGILTDYAELAHVPIRCYEPGCVNASYVLVKLGKELPVSPHFHAAERVGSIKWLYRKTEMRIFQIERENSYECPRCRKCNKDFSDAIVVFNPEMKEITAFGYEPEPA